MKKILLGILALGAVSCSNNDDEPSQNQNNIIGVWKYSLKQQFQEQTRQQF